MSQSSQKMGPSEALVEVLAVNGVKHVFGIVGSAFMDALDIFPAAGIEFVPVAHEQGAIHMADGYARASGRHGVCIAQNGPGVTNFVTGVAAAFWAHSPVVFITPETGSMSIGLGGFQETEQLPIFSKITKYQGHVNNPKRMAEIAARCFDRAMLEIDDDPVEPRPRHDLHGLNAGNGRDRSKRRTSLAPQFAKAIERCRRCGRHIRNSVGVMDKLRSPEG